MRLPFVVVVHRVACASAGPLSLYEIHPRNWYASDTTVDVVPDCYSQERERKPVTCHQRSHHYWIDDDLTVANRCRPIVAGALHYGFVQCPSMATNLANEICCTV